MNGDGHRSSLGRQLGAIWQRLIGLADEPTDDDDLRLRKRVGVIGGWMLVVLPLSLPVMAQGLTLSSFVALALPLAMSINLVVLARTRRFERYVVVLIVTVTLFPAFIEVALGGLGGASATLLFAFLGPVFAMLALGPQRATAWFVFFLVVMVGVFSRPALQQHDRATAIHAAAGVLRGEPRRSARDHVYLLALHRLRRRRAEARSEDLLTNAIPCRSRRD